VIPPPPSSRAPSILVSIDRRIVDRLLPGAIAEAETLAQGFADTGERRAWVAGRLGVQLEQLLPAELEVTRELAERFAS
jgi:hypothetical protein